MMDYIKLHMDLINHKTMWLIVIITLLILHGGIIYASQINEGYAYMDGFRHEFSLDYFNESFQLMEMTMVFLTIFIGMTLGQSNNQGLMIYTVYSRKSKLYFIVGRLLTGLFWMTLVMVYVLTLLYIFTSYTPYDLQFNDYMQASIHLYKECIQYYIWTLCLMQIFNHMLMGLIPLMVFWLLEILTSTSNHSFINHINKWVINIQGYEASKKNILIFAILYFFMSINYIIVLLKKDC